MEITGKHVICGEKSAADSSGFSCVNPATGETLAPRFARATRDEVDQSLECAQQALEQLQPVEAEAIAHLLDDIAARLETATSLLDRVHAETALPMSRLENERTRTVNQTRMFARMVRDGSWVQARIDRGDPQRLPQPKPDVRSVLVGIGPVVVFDASNFPLAISAVGTDTVSAFAAKCPVVVKGHPAHPGTNELLATIIADAIRNQGLPRGMFSLLQGDSYELGQAMVEHPHTAAVAFTGSLAGGRAIHDMAARRPSPIPVYAEMGSTNPIFVLPEAAQQRAEEIAKSYVQSVTLGAGQFCTNPGLLFIRQGESLDQFAANVKHAVLQVAPAPMLHHGIHAAYNHGVERAGQTPGIELLAENRAPAGRTCQAGCSIFLAPAELIDQHKQLQEEVFGPFSLVSACQSVDEMVAYARSMPGQLTATIHGTEKDLQDYAELVAVLQRKVGRIIFNGFPTGIEVCTAMHHGGPYPATTHSHFTSIGPLAIYRFTRPVCFQNFPNAALPVELQNKNSRGIARVVDGVLSTDDV